MNALTATTSTQSALSLEDRLKYGLGENFFRGPDTFHCRRSDRSTHEIDANIGYTPKVEVEPRKAHVERIPVSAIIDACIEVHGVYIEDFMERRIRARKVSVTRQHAYWMIKKLYPNMSLHSMAGHLNSPNHTDPLYGVRHFDEVRHLHKDKVESVVSCLQEIYGDDHPHLEGIDFYSVQS